MEKGYRVRRTSLGTSFPTGKSVQKTLGHLHDVLGYSFIKIAQEPPWQGIPLGTIHKMYRTGKVPTKWKRQLGVHTRQRLSISKENMTSAALSIYNNIDADKINKLQRELDWLMRG